MKKRLFTIPLMLFAALCLVMLPACSSGPSPEEQAKLCIDSELGSLEEQKGDIAKEVKKGMKSQMDMLGIDADEFLDAYLDGFAYKINKITVADDGESARVNVTVKVKSGTDILSGFEDEFTQKVLEKIKNGEMSANDEDAIYKYGGELLLERTKSTEPKESELTLICNKGGNGKWELSSASKTKLDNLFK